MRKDPLAQSEPQGLKDRRGPPVPTAHPAPSVQQDRKDWLVPLAPMVLRVHKVQSVRQDQSGRQVRLVHRDRKGLLVRR